MKGKKTRNVTKLDQPVKVLGLYILPRKILLLFVAVLIMAIASPAAMLVLGGLAVYALRGPKESMESLSLLAFLLIINNGIAAISSSLSLFRWLILFAVFGRLMWDTLSQNAPVPPAVMPLTIFTGTIFIFSFLFSYLPVVSALKVLTFYMGVGSALIGFYRTRHLRDYWIAWFLSLTLFIVILSMPLLASPLGYLRNGSGFQGILIHPQIFGPVAAIIAAFLTGLYLFERQKSHLLLMGVVFAWIGVFASESRTAFLAVAGGMAITLFVGIFFNNKWRPKIARVLSSGAAFFMVGFISLYLVINWTDVKTSAVEFLLKDGRQTSITESLQDSRSFLIERSMANFRASPITGIGFGVPSSIASGNTVRIETGPLGIPLGASVEKGFMPSAVLEETGITGGVLVLVLIFSLMRPIIKTGRIFSFWIFTACLLINLGEMVFFSVGGMGMFLWILMAFCYINSMPLKRNKIIRRKPSLNYARAS